MEEDVKALVSELPRIIKENTKNEYADVKEALKSMVEYVKGKKATKSGVLSKLAEIEDLLLRKKQEKNPNIHEHIQKIRQFWDVGRGLNRGTIPSSGNNGKQKNQNQSTGGIPSGQVGSATSNADLRKESPSSGTSISPQLSLTGAEAPLHPKRDQDMTSEIKFFEESLMYLRKIFENEKGAPSQNTLQLPKEKKLKGNVKNGYDICLEVAEEIRRMKNEKEHLEKVLQNLCTNVIGSNENTTDRDENAFKPPKGTEKRSKIAALYQNAAEISKKFHELNRDLDFACRRMSDVLSTIKGQGVDEQEAEPPKSLHTNNPAKAGNKQDKGHSMMPPILEQTKKLDNDFCHIQSELKARENSIQGTQSKLKQKQLLESIMDDLSKDVQDLVEGRTKVKTQSALDQRNASIDKDKEISTYQRLEQAKNIYQLQIETRREADYAAQLLEDLNKCFMNDNLEEDKNTLTDPGLPPPIVEGKENQRGKVKKENQNDKETGKNQQSRHFMQIKKYFDTASSVLHKQMGTQSKLKQKQLLESIMDDLSKDVQDLVEGRTKVETQSALDQRNASIDKDKEISTYQRLEQAKNIYQLQIEMRREADYAAQLLEDLNKCFMNDNLEEDKNTLTDPGLPPPIVEGKENQRGKVKKENQNDKETGKNQQSRHFMQIKKYFDTASSVLHKQMNVRSQSKQKLVLELILDDLSKDVQDLVEGKTSQGTQSALDQRKAAIDKEKENSIYQRLEQAKKIYDLQTELNREARYAAQLLQELNMFVLNDKEAVDKYILTEPHMFPSSDEGKENQNVKKKKFEQAGENQRSRHFLQLKKSFETALGVVDKQIEAQYAVQLLNELGQFSQTAKGDEDKHVLSDPPTKTTPSLNGSKQKKEESSQRNERPRTYYEKASVILNQMKERQRLLRVEENEDVRVKHLEDGKKNRKEIKDSLQADIKTETKQSEKRQDKLQRLEEENSVLKKEVDSWRTRLSEVAGANLAHENPSIVDLSDPNRPTKLGEKYSQLYDNEWTDAFVVLSEDDTKASQEKLTGYLYNILIDIYRFCEDIRKTQKRSLEDLIFHPAVNMESGLIRQMKEVSKILAKHLSDAAKVSSEVTSLNMVQAFENDQAMKNKHGKRINQCKKYIEECVKLCWYMQVQTPPLCIDKKTAKGQELVKDIYKEYTTKGQKIAFIVWPALFLHENGPLIAKGVAQGQ